MDQTVAASEKSRDRLVDITLDAKSLGRANSNIEHEREVAIFDILDGNAFRIEGMDAGPYKLTLSLADDRLLLAISPSNEVETIEQSIALTPLKRIVCFRFRRWMTPFSTAAPSTVVNAMSVPSGPTNPNFSGMCISRLRLSEGVGGTDCSTCSVNCFAAMSWFDVTVRFGVPA